MYMSKRETDNSCKIKKKELRPPLCLGREYSTTYHAPNGDTKS